MVALNFPLRNDDDWVRFARAMKEIDRSQPWQASIQPYRKSRSLQQNRLLHCWFKIIGDELGYSVEEMKALLKEQFLVPKIVSFRGTNRLLYASSSDMKSAEVDEWMTKIQAFAATDLNIQLPSTL